MHAKREGNGLQSLHASLLYVHQYTFLAGQSRRNRLSATAVLALPRHPMNHHSNRDEVDGTFEAAARDPDQAGVGRNSRHRLGKSTRISEL